MKSIFKHIISVTDKQLSERKVNIYDICYGNNVYIKCTDCYFSRNNSNPCVSLARNQIRFTDQNDFFREILK